MGAGSSDYGKHFCFHKEVLLPRNGCKGMSVTQPKMRSRFDDVNMHDTVPEWKYRNRELGGGVGGGGAAINYRGKTEIHGDKGMMFKR